MTSVWRKFIGVEASPLVFSLPPNLEPRIVRGLGSDERPNKAHNTWWRNKNHLQQRCIKMFLEPKIADQNLAEMKRMDTNKNNKCNKLKDRN